MRTCLFLLAISMAGPTAADSLDFDVRGLYSPLTQNARNSIENQRISDTTRLSQRRIDRIMREAETRVIQSLKPFGYYHATVRASLNADHGRSRTIVLDVDKGRPVRVVEVNIQLNGPGADFSALEQWVADWPLTPGTVLKHGEWEAAKQEALDLLDFQGYINARFSTHRIELDLDRNEARLHLTLDTGPRAVMGEVRFEQDIVEDELLQKLPRFEPGQPYDGRLLEQLRQDLWKTGFYTTIDVVEDRNFEQSTPVVDLDARLEERKRDTWESQVGVGSDTKARAKVKWTRHWLSERGDSLGMGVGWQQRDDRYLFRTDYRLPRRTNLRSYWLAETLFRDENEKLQVSPQNQPDSLFTLASGDVENYLFKGGILNIRDIGEDHHQISETWFVQYLRENISFDLPAALAMDENGAPVNQFNRLFTDDNSSVAIGAEWDWPEITGQGFETVGHHQLARLFTAQDAWASNREFSQVYLSTRWNFMVSDRIKFLLRAELGYSDARVDEFEVAVPDDVIRVSLTELPNLYRFQAGGSQSVRGYSFESLSNNGIGSNNLVTFSMEGEWEFRENWSMAAFYDIGNAFNDWSEMDLKQGVGLGLRWYSIAGPVRLDFASALDLPGDPWRIHFTIGVPLL